MKNLYFFSNQIYQLSYALPFYNKLGGTFIVNSKSKYFRFKRHLCGLAKFGEKNLLNTPSIIIRENHDLSDLEGVILSFSNNFLKRKKNTIAIFHEHGASDKRIGSNENAKTKEKLKNFDYIFLMSPKNLIKINALQIDIPKDKFIKIHNLRFYSYYSFLNNKEEIKRKRKISNDKPTVLYAPTWRFGNGTLKKYFHRFAKELTKDFNLIVRPHFHDTKYIPLYKTWSKLHNIKNLYFSNPSNLAKYDTMLDFAISDILLSDTSAAIYEYLVTKNPIIIIDPNYEKRVKMPAELDIMKNAVIFTENNNINDLVKQTLKEKKYSKNYDKMFQACFYQADNPEVANAISFIKELL